MDGGGRHAAGGLRRKIRWLTPEFIFYVGYIAFLVVYSIPTLMGALDEACHSKPGCGHHLKRGWLFGRRVDLTDPQWHDFRSNLPVLVVLLSVYVALGRAAARVGMRLAYYVVSSIAFLFYAYGANAFFVLALALANFVVTRAVAGRPGAPAVIWVFNLAALLSTEWIPDKYHFVVLFGDRAAFLDAYTGVLRWYVGFNLVTLRMISFAMDYHWALQKPSPPTAIEERSKRDDGRPLDPYEVRVTTSRAAHEYSLPAYLAYLFYIPLHVAGPTITCNAFLSQLESPQTTYSLRDIFKYGIRVVIGILLMEIITHTFYCYAVVEAGAFRGLSTLAIGLLGYYSLHLIWLKFYIIWRFFRFWALLDGVETVENMNRCMSNNYNLQGFWRSWHRSFNRWLVRYVFVPLGGGRHRFRNTFVVFTFTALWHDLSLSLLTWGWLLAIFIVPETLLSMFMRRPAMKGVREASYYRHLCAFGGALNIFFMMVVNLIGFSVGVDGMSTYLASIFSWDSIPFLAGTLLAFFSATHIMFEWREMEDERKGF